MSISLWTGVAVVVMMFSVSQRSDSWCLSPLFHDPSLRLYISSFPIFLITLMLLSVNLNGEAEITNLIRLLELFNFATTSSRLFHLAFIGGDEQSPSQDEQTSQAACSQGMVYLGWFLLFSISLHSYWANSLGDGSTPTSKFYWFTFTFSN